MAPSAEHDSRATESQYFVARHAFLSGLGLVYLLAFSSLWVQVEGLIGAGGILPAFDVLSATAARGEGFLDLPTIGWFVGTSDIALHTMCAAGVLVSLLLIAGTIPGPASALCWLLYLSLYSLGQSFLSFQWDILLLETGLLAIFLAPPLGLRPLRDRAARPSVVVIWLLRILVFKLMFSSGVVKLSSGDPTWADLSALSHHYETTCLPTWSGWLMHQLPLGFHEASAVAMFAIELVVPFFVFGTRLMRLIAAAAFSALMIFIGATGNYGFFNILGLVLCIPLLDDSRWPRWLRERLGPRPAETKRDDGELGKRGSRWVVVPLAVLIGLANVIPLVNIFRVRVSWPSPLLWVHHTLMPFHVASGYGLFAVMTTKRPEIIIEGSNDLETWQAYELPYKPGDLERRPGFVQPHMPRLDWLMWFAALRGRPPHWFGRFAHRLLEGSEPVLGLLEHNPFPGDPPRYLRATLYDYRFASPGNDAWWTRRLLRSYIVVVTIPPEQPDRLAVVRTILNRDGVGN